MKKGPHFYRLLTARLAVILVFIWNIQCALVFIFTPGRFVGAYELTGAGGLAAIQGMGVAFLMWNVTYPPVIFSPIRHLFLFKIVIIQQVVGLIGELHIFLITPVIHTNLRTSILKFILFDAAGLILMFVGYILIAKRKKLGYDN